MDAGIGDARAQFLFGRGLGRIPAYPSSYYENAALIRNRLYCNRGLAGLNSF